MVLGTPVMIFVMPRDFGLLQPLRIEQRGTGRRESVSPQDYCLSIQPLREP